MATYKKRGYKHKTAPEKELEIESGSTTAEVFNTLDQGASKTEAWVEANQKPIFILVAFVAITVLGFIGYQKMISEPKQVEAANEVYQASSYYDQALVATTQRDSLFRMALNGYAGKYGLLDIVDKFSGTPAGSLASYQAGVAYYNLKQYDLAIQFMDQFDGDDALITPLAQGVLGDSFAQLNQFSEALRYYKEAASYSDNDITTPRFLLKVGTTAMKLGDFAEAEKAFSRITEDYSAATQAVQAKAYLAQAGVKR